MALGFSLGMQVIFFSVQSKLSRACQWLHQHGSVHFVWKVLSCDVFMSETVALEQVWVLGTDSRADGAHG